MRTNECAPACYTDRSIPWVKREWYLDKRDFRVPLVRRVCSSTFDESMRVRYLYIRHTSKDAFSQSNGFKPFSRQYFSDGIAALIL